MGLVKSFYKLSAPDSMTISVIKGYRVFKNEYPDMSDNDIFHEIIKVRYTKEQDRSIYEVIFYRIGSYKSLYDLIIEMLIHESRDFATLPSENQLPIKKAVKDLLRKEGLQVDE